MSSEGSMDEGMDQLLDFAETVGFPPQQEENQVVKLSNDLISLTSRLSELSAEKLKIDFENREMRAKTVPIQIEMNALRDENAFLKNQLKEYWSEIEKVSQQKNNVYRERCETVRKLTDEVSNFKSEMGSIKTRMELGESERDRYRQQCQVIQSEMTFTVDQLQSEILGYKDKISRQDKMISVLEKQSLVNEEMREKIASMEQALGIKDLELVDAETRIDGLREEISDLKLDKEKLLNQAGLNKENKKAAHSADQLLGRSNWSLSDIVDELSDARKDISAKRKEIDSLRTQLDEIQGGLRNIEELREVTERCQYKAEELGRYNEELKAKYEEREDLVDKLAFEKMKLETEVQSCKIRLSELTKQVATLIHENESIRNRTGIHSGPGRSNPRLSGDEKSLALPGVATTVAHFRTVLDLVEENSDLKAKVDRLLGESETDSQRELVQVRHEFSKLESVKSDLIKKREEDRVEFDRVVARLESDLAKSRTDSDRLRRVVVGDNDFAMMVDEDVGDMEESRLKITRDEFDAHLSRLKAELEAARKLNSKTVSELDKIREDLKREMDAKNHYISGYERLKSENLVSITKISDLSNRLNSAENERDSLSVRLEEIRLGLIKADLEKKDLEMKLSTCTSKLASLENAYQTLSLEKENQSSVLAGYHQRMEQESKLYSTNSESLKKLYLDESEKSRQTLSFYQSAYEDQVKRSNELMSLVTRLEGEISGKSKISDQIEELRNQYDQVSTQKKSLEEQIQHLESVVKSAEADASQWRTAAQSNEDIANELRAEIDQLRSQISEFEPSKPETDQVMVDTSELNSRIELLESQISAKSNEFEIMEKQFVLEKEEREAVESSNKQLQEELHQMKLISSVYSENDELIIAREKLEEIASEKKTLEDQIISLKRENEQLQKYLASEISDKDEQAVFDELRSSISNYESRESRLLEDLDRVRATNDVLLRENFDLKKASKHQNELQAQIVDFETLKEKNVNLLDENLKLRGVSEKLVLVESENSTLKARLDQVSQELASKMNLDEDELIKLRKDYAQLDNAKSQLVSTVSKLREEATKRSADITKLEKEVSRQDGLMKLKDKRIGELEEQISSPAPVQDTERIKQLMQLVNEYQSALNNMLSQEESSSANKKARQSVYHDAVEGNMSD
jgi:chromosome segregation ATPase